MWKFAALLNAILQLLVTVLLGGLIEQVGFMNADQFVDHGAKYVCEVAVPCLLLRGFGIEVDFYSADWAFVAAFVVLCSTSLCGCVLAVLLTNYQNRNTSTRKEGIGTIIVFWNCLTLTSTIIMGVPLCTGLLDDAEKGTEYSMLAAVAVFLYQFPLQIAAMEWDAAFQREASTDGQAVEHRCIHRTCSKSIHPVSPDDKSRTVVDETTGNNTIVDEEVGIGNNTTIPPTRSAVCTSATKKILKKVVIQSELLGVILSVSTIGPRYLSPQSKDYVHGLGWLYYVLKWLGACASPVSLFIMGIWMKKRGWKRLLLDVGLIKVAAFMLLKLLAVPLVMLSLAAAMSLSDEAGRVAVLMSTFPIAMVSFPISHEYSSGEAILSANLSAGLVMLLPTLLLWNLAMDSLGLFPIVERRLI